jgi:8-oxo-dGTP diphosphatase
MKMTELNSFRHQLPESRLGQSHDDIESFQQAASKCGYHPSTTKEFTLIVVTAAPRHILLGFKNRGFGKGMYNSFGGKFDHADESPEECASRELLEETNICVTPIALRNSKVGILRFTSEDDPMEMLIHAYRIHMPQKDCPLYSDIRACEEITPKWYDDWQEIPLDNMFADDSHWLVALLPSTDRPLEINGSFHFQRNSQETNTIMHYYMEMKEKPKFTLEKRLFHAIHDFKGHPPSTKEFKECFAFQNAVRSALKRKGGVELDIVIDVAGGHGALAALFLICTSATKAVVVDPARVGNGGVEWAWKRDFFSNKELVYRPECLRTGLPAELKDALSTTSPERILVVACHACQHLSEETLDIACRYGVHVAVMPCCQKDLSEGGSWKATSKNLLIPIGPTMDLLLAGKMMASKNYDVRMKVIDSKITPQNRVIICQALSGDVTSSNRSSNVEAAHAKLQSAYRRAHDEKASPETEDKRIIGGRQNNVYPAFYLGVGFLAGALFAASSLRKR